MSQLSQWLTYLKDSWFERAFIIYNFENTYCSFVSVYIRYGLNAALRDYRARISMTREITLIFVKNSFLFLSQTQVLVKILRIVCLVYS